jgi:NitT/TauT family transport system substrate-binding protein
MSRLTAKCLLAALILGGVLFGMVLLWLSQERGRSAAELTPPERLTLGLALQPSSALAILAYEQGFFEEQGLDLACEDYVSGKRAMAALLEGRVEVASVAQVPVVFAAFQRQDFCTVATIAHVTNVQRVVGRRDRGIQGPADLRGKRVATQQASAVHFSLHMFLVKNGLSEGDITLSFLEPEQLPNALAAGRIDAFSMREPYVSQSVRLLGRNAVVLAEPGIDFQPEHLVVAADALRRKPGIVPKMLRALIRAEKFAKDHREKAIDIVAGRLKADRNELASSWADLDLTVGLDQSLLSSMEDVARWAIKDRLVTDGRVPNFLRLIDLQGLKAVAPESVTIIH